MGNLALFLSVRASSSASYGDDVPMWRATPHRDAERMGLPLGSTAEPRDDARAGRQQLKLGLIVEMYDSRIDAKSAEKPSNGSRVLRAAHEKYGPFGP